MQATIALGTILSQALVERTTTGISKRLTCVALAEEEAPALVPVATAMNVLTRTTEMQIMEETAAHGIILTKHHVEITMTTISQQIRCAALAVAEVAEAAATVRAAEAVALPASLGVLTQTEAEETVEATIALGTPQM